MGKNFLHHDPSEHHPGCIKGFFFHFHNRGMNFARKKLNPRRNPNGKWIAVDEDDRSSRSSDANREDREKFDSAAEGSVSESGSVHKKSMKSRIKSLISEEVSKRTGRHKRSSSCPTQTLINRNNPINQNSHMHHLEPFDKSNVQVNEDMTGRSSSKVEEEPARVPSPCDLCDAMSTIDYLRKNQVNDKGKRTVKDDTILKDKSIYSIDHNRTASLEESRLFLDALDLLNMRKELFLKVLRDPSSSLAQQMHEKRLSKSRGGLTKSMSLPCPRLEEKDVKHEINYSTHGDTKLPSDIEKSCVYTSARESNDQSMSLDKCSDEATPKQPQKQPKPSGNVSPVPCHQLITGQDKVVIKRFKNLGEKIRHAIKESKKERQHIMKDAVLHKIPHGKKSKGYNGQGDTSEKPPKIYMKNNLEQKGFNRASSFNVSCEKYNRLLESDASREAKGKEPETLRLKRTVTPTPISTIPKTLNRIYSSPDLGLYHGFQNEESLDSTWWETSATSMWVGLTSNEGSVISGQQKYLESNSSTGSQTPMIKISKCESQENSLDAGEGLDVMSKCENIEDAGKDSDKISKCDSQENSVDSCELLDKNLKCEGPEKIDVADEKLDRMSNCEIQQNFIDASEGLDKIPKCENQENIVDADEGSKRISKNESQENFVDVGDRLEKISKCDSQENVEDAGEGLDRISKCESRQNFIDAGEGLDRISKCDGPENVEDVDESLDRKSKCGSGENFGDAGFEDTGDLSRRNSASNIELIADKPIVDIAYDSSHQEDDTDPAKYNLQDDILLDGEYCLTSQQHESSRDGTTVYENERGFSATQFHDTSVSQVQVDKNSRVEFDYVQGVLDLSGFNRNECLGNWHSPGQPVDPAVLDEVKDILLVQTGLSEIEDRSYDHILMFDLVNEVLLDIYHKSSSYWPKPLSFRSSIRPMPMGCHVLEEVCADINCYLEWKPTSDQAYIDDGDAVAQDFSKYDGWMNLQFDSECVGLELEELLFDDLIEELLSDMEIN